MVSFGLMLQNPREIFRQRASPGWRRLGFGGCGLGLPDVQRSSHQSKRSLSHSGDFCSCLFQQRENHSSRKTNFGREDR